MLKRIIKTHTARLDFCLYYRAYFFFNETLSFTNRERRVIASLLKSAQATFYSRLSCLCTWRGFHFDPGKIETGYLPVGLSQEQNLVDLENPHLPRMSEEYS